ncbi:MAG: hypothetical protein HY908_01135 [Myxococcales bacterium]|nr:hypothetical protein [Myxococcales bacterium]
MARSAAGLAALAALTALTALAGCDATPEPPPVRRARSPERPTAAAVASGAAGCIRLEDVSFSECNPHPGQTDYPECWQYSFMLHPAPDGGGPECRPRTSDFFITGYPAISDQKRVELVYDGDPPVRAKILEVGVDESPLRDTVRGVGRELGTLVLEGGVVTELLFGPGMPSHLHSRSVAASPRP